MRQTLKFLLALLIAFVVMMGFRAVALTVFTIHTHAMQPVFKEGDCVLVNRWSYGLRVGGENIFPYGRICRQEIEKGDIVAMENAQGHIVTGKILAVPGETISLNGKMEVVPGLVNCADRDYYWTAAVGKEKGHSAAVLIAEEQIIGRITHIIYNNREGITQQHLFRTCTVVPEAQ